MGTMEKPKLQITEIKQGDQVCTIVHVPSPDGKVHVVAIGALKVVIAKDGPSTWFAQGLDIDYSAEGTSVEDVKQNFQNGLISTIDQHLKVFNGISELLKAAPNDVWQELFYGPLLGQNKTVKNYYAVSIHMPDEIKKVTAITSFENIGIEYFELDQAA